MFMQTYAPTGRQTMMVMSKAESSTGSTERKKTPTEQRLDNILKRSTSIWDRTSR